MPWRVVLLGFVYAVDLLCLGIISTSSYVKLKKDPTMLNIFNDIERSGRINHQFQFSLRDMFGVTGEDTLAGQAHLIGLSQTIQTRHHH